MTITALPTPPSRQDAGNFVERADTFLGALPTFATEANALASELNTNLVSAEQIKDDTTAIKNATILETTAIKNEAVSATQAIANQASSSASLASTFADSAEIQANIAASAARFKGEWKITANYLVGDSVVRLGLRYLALSNNTAQPPELSTNNWFEIRTEGNLIREPRAIAPLNGTSSVLPNVTLEATPYAALYSSDTRTYRRFEVALSTDVSFSAPVFTSDVDADTLQVSPNLSVSAVYIWRCKDVSVAFDSSQIESDWMQYQEFTTANISVSVPTVNVSGSPDAVTETPTISSSAFATIPADNDTHLSSDWEVRLASNNSLIWSSYNNTVDKLSIVVPSSQLVVGTSYIFRARHVGTTYGVSPWGSVTASTLASFLDAGDDIDGLASLVSIQQDYSSVTTYSIGQVVKIVKGSLRIVEYTSLVNSNLGNNPKTSPAQWQMTFDNNSSTAGYFGEVLGNTCVVDRGEWNAATAYVAGNMVVVKTGAGFTQDDLTAYVSKTSNTNKAPASNPSDWTQKNALPTGTSLAQTLGIASANPEVLINNDSGWLKFIHKGKIKYIAKKTFIHSVSWNDIAKAEAVFGNRTVRIGSRLFRVSILTGAEADPSSWVTTSTATDNKGAGSEWNELVYRVHTDVPTDGSATNHGGKQVGASWANFSNTDINISGNYTWCRETLSYNTSYRVLRGGASLSDFNYDSSSNANSNFGWRPCLTLISEPQADSKLYGAEASGVGQSVASLQYDPITDTGFYGEVTAASFYTGSSISTACAITSGTLQFDTEPWLKFYWHGMVLFISKKPYRHTISWDNINSANSVYGVNLGAAGRKTITHAGSSTQYDVKLMKGATQDPTPASSPRRQWNELIYRVAAENPAGEIGANWASYTSADLQITGNGGYTWCQEVYKPNTATRVTRGYVSLSGFNTYSSSDAYSLSGWRPCLALVR